MKKLFLALSLCTLPLTLRPTIPESLTNLALGTTTAALAWYAASETLLDCGHQYQELKKVYWHYLQELILLDPDHRITTLAEKQFWAKNQMLSRFPHIFWREIASGSFTIFTAVLAKNYLTKASTI